MDMPQRKKSHDNKGEERMKQSDALRAILDPGQVPHLYGRDEETKALREAYRRSITNESGENEIVLISGSSGSGKTILAQTLRTRPGWFLSGMFEETAGKEPYAVFVQAFTEYVDQIYNKAPHRIPQLKKSINNLVGAEGGLLTELIPALTKIMGPQPHVSRISAQAALQRFQFVFGMLIKGICKVHPLTLFLDDLQWADAASLELVDTLLSLKSNNEVLPLLVVGSHRPVDDDERWCLTTAIHEWKRRVRVTEIRLSDWSAETLNQFLSETLRQDEKRTLPLSLVIHEQTQGNIFYVLQFLRLLVEQEVLYRRGEEWRWNLDQLESWSATELLLHQMKQLPHNVQRALKLAACMGTVDDSGIALMLEEKANVDSVLRQASDAGLLIFSPQMGGYRFAHDRIRQVALMLIEEPGKYELYVGRRLWDHLTDDNIFVVVTLLNRSSMLIHNKQERYRLAELNLNAGEKAASHFSFLDAAFYFNSGIDLLGLHHWKEEYALSLALYDAAAEVEMCNANFEHVKELITQVLENAQTLGDKLRSYMTLMSSVAQQDDVDEAMKIGFQVMRELGQPLPKSPSTVAIVSDLVRTKLALCGKTPEDFLSMPLMTDENKIWCSEVLNNLLKSAFACQSHYTPILVCRIIQLCMRHGLYRYSAVGFAFYALILNLQKEGRKEGAEMAKVAFAVLETSGAEECLSRVYAIVYSGVHHWNSPLRDALDPLKFAMRVGMETGDVQHSMYCANLFCSYSYYSGLGLHQLEEYYIEYSRQMKTYKQENVLLCHKPIGQLIHNLTGRAENPAVLKGDIMDVDKSLYEAYDTHNTLHASVCLQLSEYVAYIFGDYERAYSLGETLRKTQGFKTSFWGKVESCFIGCLTSAVMARKDPSNQKTYLKIGRMYSKRMARWASNCPSNFLHKQKLMEAELAGLSSFTTIGSSSVLKLYDEAIQGARREGVIHEEALACERASEYMTRMNNATRAAEYLHRASSLYSKWGATAKTSIKVVLPHVEPVPGSTTSLSISV